MGSRNLLPLIFEISKLETDLTQNNDIILAKLQKCKHFLYLNSKPTFFTSSEFNRVTKSALERDFAKRDDSNQSEEM